MANYFGSKLNTEIGVEESLHDNNHNENENINFLTIENEVDCFLQCQNEDDSNKEEFQNTHLHSSKLHQMLFQQFKKQQNLDLIIKSNKTKISVHRWLFAACCPRIKNYLTEHPNSQEIDLSNLNSECVRKIIDWCYTGSMHFSISIMKDFLVAASFLKIHQIFPNCTDFIFKEITFDNCFEIYNSANTAQAFEFKSKVKTYILKNFVEIFRQEKHLKVISKEEMIEIIMDPSLFIVDKDGYPMTDCDAEFCLFNLLCKYICHTNLSHYWPDILKNSLRMSIMSEQQLEEIRKIMNDLVDLEVKKECLKVLEIALRCKQGEKVGCPMWLQKRENLDRLRYSPSETFCSTYLHHNQSELKSFNDLKTQDGYTSKLMFITAMKVVVRNGWWVNKVKTKVIAGLEITYNNGYVIFHGGNDEKWEEYKFELAPNEKITHVVMRAGHVVDSLKFYTSNKQEFGPYGEKGGEEIVLQPETSNGFLATISGSTVKSQGYDLIRCVSFVWGCLKPHA